MLDFFTSKEKRHPFVRKYYGKSIFSMKNKLYRIDLVHQIFLSDVKFYNQQIRMSVVLYNGEEIH